MRGKVTDVRGINLGHVLEHHGGSKHALPITIDENGNLLRYSLAKISATEVIDAPLWTDDLSSLRHGFARLPIEYLFHDDRLNPRGIGSNIRGLAIEFFAKFPQLHVPLAWIDSKEEGGPRVRIFDGQHKAAAQVLLGVRYLPLRIFVDPDPDLLLTANTIEKAIYSQTIFGGMLDTPDDHKVEAGDNPRDLVREQIVTLLNIIDRIFVGEWDPVIGSGKLESKVQKDQDVPEGHLRAHRLAREEIYKLGSNLRSPFAKLWSSRQGRFGMPNGHSIAVYLMRFGKVLTASL